MISYRLIPMYNTSTKIQMPYNTNQDRREYGKYQEGEEKDSGGSDSTRLSLWGKWVKSSGWKKWEEVDGRTQEMVKINESQKMQCGEEKGAKV